ncbi:hypothetical protein [Mucilaginibacter gynuensis]
MIKQCKNCSNATGTVAELLSIYENGDTPRMMNVLTETVAHDENLHQEDRCQLARVMHLLIAMMKEKVDDQSEQLTEIRKVG